MRLARTHVADTRQFVRLRDLHEQQALRALGLAHHAQAQAQAQLQRRSEELAGWRARREALLQHLAGAGAERIARLLPNTHAHREQLEDRIERTQFALYDDEAALAEAARRLDEAHAAWQRSRARQDAATDLMHAAVRHARRDGERRLEADEPPTAPAPHPFSGDFR
jgi:chromosome segregation ATPase